MPFLKSGYFQYRWRRRFSVSSEQVLPKVPMKMKIPASAGVDGLRSAKAIIAKYAPVARNS